MKTSAVNFSEAARLSEDLTSKGATFTQLELRLPAGLSKQEWATIGRKLCRAEQTLRWWAGDWAAYGIEKFGEIKEFAAANNVDYQPLAMLAWVSKSVEPSRRRETLDWSKHAEIAILPAEEQIDWLEKIESENLARADIRRQIRQAKGEQNALEGDGPRFKFISSHCDELTHWLRNQPPEFWDEERKSAWKKRLEPIVRFYESL